MQEVEDVPADIATPQGVVLGGIHFPSGRHLRGSGILEEHAADREA